MAPKRKYPFIKKEMKTSAYLCKVRESRRRMVLEHYSGSPPKCQNCGNTTYEMLELDHKNNDGKKDRKLGADIYQSIIKNSFPEGFQVLCANCHRYKTKTENLPIYSL